MFQLLYNFLGAAEVESEVSTIAITIAGPSKATDETILGLKSRERKSNHKKVRKINFLQDLGQKWEDDGPQERGQGRRVLGGNFVVVDDNVMVFVVHPE